MMEDAADEKPTEAAEMLAPHGFNADNDLTENNHTTLYNNQGN